MRILITGASGQLGRALTEKKEREWIPVHHAAAPPGEAKLDLRDDAAIRDLVARTRPDWVVHAAAMTDVDACERDPVAAQAVNGHATGVLAEACAAAGARMVYVSTDYVFDGQRGGYREEDPVAPASAYGRSKLEGERLARKALPDAAVARTSVVFGPHKRNFVTWAAGELHAGRRVRIAHDQVVSPTHVEDLADQILALVDTGASGVWHTAGATALSRLDMAHAIADAFHLDKALVEPVLSSALSWLAPRPRNSSLDVGRIRRLKPPLSLGEALDRLKARWRP